MCAFSPRRRLRAMLLRWRDQCRPGVGDEWRLVAASLTPFGRMTKGNSIVVHSRTSDAFVDMWKAVDAARQSIVWHTYICKDDQVGRTTMAKLEAAVDRGVKVELLYDCGGNITGRNRLVEGLRARGAVVIRYRPFVAAIWTYIASGLRWQHSPAVRNHRKILVVDKEVAFVGGLNIGDDYCGTDLGGNGRFRDTLCVVRGPAVEDIFAVTRDTLNDARESSNRVSRWRSLLRGAVRNKTRLANRLQRRGGIAAITSSAATRAWDSVRHRRNLPFTGNVESLSQLPTMCQVIQCNPHTRDWGLQVVMWQVVRHATHSVWITTPYYMPFRRLTAAMIHAARRGVDVRIIAGSSRTTDPWFMWYASQHLTRRLLRAGIRIFEYEGSGILHAKTVVVDRYWCSVGSYNWDVMSNKNLEVCVTSLGVDVAVELERHFTGDMKHCREISHLDFDERSIVQRVFAAFAYAGMRIAEKIGFWSYDDPELNT